jgi:hypothetical protein
MPISLGRALRRHPSARDGLRISLVGKGIQTLVSDIAPVYRNETEVLLISQNPLSCLRGVDQFVNLRVLSMGSCRIGDVEEVAHLRTLTHLEVLNLDGCPVTLTPHYRQHVIHILPSLRMLDGKEIHPAERRAAEPLLRQESVRMAQMLYNDCLVIKLTQIVSLLRVHAELRKRLFGPMGAARSEIRPPCHVDVARLMRIWDYEGQLGPVERRNAYRKFRGLARKFWNALRLQRRRRRGEAKG